jgi:hypothetical protein
VINSDIGWVNSLDSANVLVCFGKKIAIILVKLIILRKGTYHDQICDPKVITSHSLAAIDQCLDLRLAAKQW